MRPQNERAPEGGVKRKWVKRTGGKHAAAKRPSVKNQIRSIERLLKREGIPPKLREEKARELEKLRDAGKENARIEREKKLSTKYHKVKFFERVKLTRRKEQLEKKRDDDGALGADELDELAQVKEDLEYVMNFPRGEKYVSVLVKEGDTEHATKERARLRKLVKANLAASAALGDENEGGADMAAQGDAAIDAEQDDFFLNESDDGNDSDSSSSSSSSSSSPSSSSSSSSSSKKARTPVHIPKKELPVTKDPIYIKNHAQKLVERSERAKAEASKDGNKPQRTRAEGGRKRRKK